MQSQSKVLSLKLSKVPFTLCVKGKGSGKTMDKAHLAEGFAVDLFDIGQFKLITIKYYKQPYPNSRETEQQNLKRKKKKKNGKGCFKLVLL